MIALCFYLYFERLKNAVLPQTSPMALILRLIKYYRNWICKCCLRKPRLKLNTKSEFWRETNLFNGRLHRASLQLSYQKLLRMFSLGCNYMSHH